MVAVTAEVKPTFAGGELLTAVPPRALCELGAVDAAAVDEVPAEGSSCS